MKSKTKLKVMYSLFVAFVMAIACFSFANVYSVSAQTEGSSINLEGDGSETTPYLISSLEELEFFRDDGDLYAVINYNQIICGVLALVSAGILAFLIVRLVKKGEKIWYGKGGIPKELLPKVEIYSKAKKKENCPRIKARLNKTRSEGWVGGGLRLLERKVNPFGGGGAVPTHL